MTYTRSSAAKAFRLLTALALVPAAAAQDYPARPVRFVVPFVAGGSMDFIGQVLGKRMAASTGQNFYIDNRAGAGGSIGTAVAAKAPTDGYTILLTSIGHTILPAIRRDLTYDPVKDFAPITRVADSVGTVLVVHPSVPARSVKEFITLAKAHPGMLNYASGGIGHVMHFAAESFSAVMGISMTHIPYKGVGQAIIDLIAGRTDLGIISATSSVPHIRAGKLRPLAITASQRWSDLPEVPTMQEAGAGKYQYSIWYGMWFPAGVPTAYVSRIHAEVTRALEDPGAQAAFRDRGLVPVVSTPQEFRKTVVAAI